jgi:hypothetical protein
MLVLVRERKLRAAGLMVKSLLARRTLEEYVRRSRRTGFL